MRPCEQCEKMGCTTVHGARSLVGAWARERRRQGLDLIDGNVRNQAAMDKAIEKPVELFLNAKCPCPCHDEVNRG